MIIWRARLALLVAAGLVCVGLLPNAAQAGPGELTVVSMLPVKEVLVEVLAKYQRDTGEAVGLSFVSQAQLKAKVHGTDHPDLVIASQEAMDKLEQEGQTQSGIRSPLVQSGLGIAVRRGAAVVDLSSAETLKRALLNARSLGYADPQESPAGQQAASVLERLGIALAVKGKTQFGNGNNPVAPIGFGDVEIGLYPVHAILLAKEAQLAALLPMELQQWTRYDAALITGAPNANEARRLLAYLAGATARASFVSGGFRPAP